MSFFFFCFSLLVGCCDCSSCGWYSSSQLLYYYLSGVYYNKTNSYKITVFLLLTRKTFGLCAFVFLSVLFLCISSFHLLLIPFLDSGFWPLTCGVPEFGIGKRDCIRQAYLWLCMILSKFQDVKFIADVGVHWFYFNFSVLTAVWLAEFSCMVFVKGLFVLGNWIHRNLQGWCF